MATCKQCREFEKCKDDSFINGAKFDPNESAKYCTGFEPITNADRIRAMREQELVELIGHNSLCNRVQSEDDNWCSGHNCTDCLTEWLKQPAEEDNHA